MNRVGSITANPNPIPVREGSVFGATTLAWSSTGTKMVEVRVGAPDGDLLSRTGPSGSATTGEWVGNGLVFYLQDVSDGLPLTPANTLGTIAVRVETPSSRAGGSLDARGDGDTPAVGKVSFGDLRRLTPISRRWGLDRGRPIDRYYIENFLAWHSSDIRGHVLSIGDDGYTRRFGRNRVTESDVLHVEEGHPQTTIVGDLASAPQIPSDAFDCVICPQTLQFIYDQGAAAQTLHRILRPGGVLLVTVPGISQTCDRDWGEYWCWNFTPLALRRIFGEIFPARNLLIEAWGNVLVATSFLQGLAVEELSKEEMENHDPGYEVVITMRAVKPVELAGDETSR
ncbi:MAG: methyltransferase domain-containing protein [Acidobacteria bacterium]|nr:methyltransferase domain-containing protein [Acidobacteriota bacterium]